MSSTTTEIPPVADWQLFTRAEREEIYQDWLDSITSEEKFAEHYHMTIECLNRILDNQHANYRD